MVEPTLVELETADESCKPGRPTTPWLFAVKPAPKSAPAFAVFRVAPAALPAVVTTLPEVDATPPSKPPRDGSEPAAIALPPPPIAMESPAIAAEVAAWELQLRLRWQAIP